MVNERTKMAESIDTVHTHTHTHHILTNRIGGQSGELTFNKINNMFNIDYSLKDSNKSLRN